MARPRRRAGDRWRRLALSVAVLLGLVAVGWGVHWLLTAPVFRVARIETSRYRFTVRDSLEARLQTGLGKNLWRCDTRALARGIAALPWVASARVGRRLPGTLTVSLVERRPRLLLAEEDDVGLRTQAAPGDLRALADGSVLLDLPSEVDVPDLPFLVDRRGKPFDAAFGGTLLDLLAAAEGAGFEVDAGVDYILADDRGLSLVLAGSRIRLLVGERDFAARLTRYRTVRPEVGPGDVVDLRFQGQVYLRDEVRKD